MTANNGEPVYDVVVVGGGAAGLNAALVLSRARRRVAVVDDRAPRNAPAAQMHGFVSRDGVSAAGNVVDPHAQVVTAAGQGSAAAIALNTDLLNDDVERAMADLIGPIFAKENHDGRPDQCS